MIWAFLGFLLVGLLLIFCAYLSWTNQERAYERIISLITNDRDSARHECEVLRARLIPGYIAKEAKPPKAVTAAEATAEVLKNTKVPWRKRVGQLVALHNTKQQVRDGLTEAIRNQPQGESSAKAS